MVLLFGCFVAQYYIIDENETSDTITIHNECIHKDPLIELHHDGDIVTIYKDSLRVVPHIVDYDKDLEIKMTCKVYQYSGKNSLNKKVTKIIKYYSNGRIASEAYKGYKETAHISSSHGKSHVQSLLRDVVR